MTQLQDQINELLEPIIKEKLDTYRGELEIQDHKPGSIPRSIDEKRRLLEEKERVIRNGLIRKDIEEACTRGWQILLEKIEELPDFATIKENLSHLNDISKVKFKEEIEKDQNFSMQKAIGISNETYQSFYKIGLELFNQQEIDPALSVFLLLTRLNAHYVDPWLGLGYCYQQLSKYQEAIECYEEAIKLEPNYSKPYLGMAECHFAMGQMKETKEILEKAMLYLGEDSKESLTELIARIT